MVTIGTIELVLFSIKENFTEKQVMAAAAKLNNFVENQPGFLSRILSKGEGNNWKDLVYWTDITSAQKAAENVMKEPSTAEFMNMIEESTIQFYHFAPKMEFVSPKDSQL